MKKVINIINTILIPIKLILAVLLIFVSFEYLNKVFINKDVSYGNDFRALPENSIDVLVLGSSDAQYSFVPSFFYEDTGLYSYVRGTPCQPLEVSYEMLKESLKTQNPKLVVLEVFTALPLRSICEDDVCYVTAQYEMTGREKYNTINYLPEEKAKEYRNDFINYHNDWRTREDYESILPANVLCKENKLGTFFGYVYQRSDDEFPSNYWFPLEYEEDDDDVILDKLDLESLNNIYNLCKEKDIELLLYKTPIDGITKEDQSYLHKVWKWANENEIKYIDFISLAKELNFYMQIHSDAFHCNINGASILTKYMADFINQNYEIKHVQNKELDKLYIKEIWWLSKDAIDTESDPLVYLKRMENIDTTICLRYNPYANKKITNGLYKAICKIGCSYFDISNNYYAIIKNGILVCESSEPIEYDDNEIKILIDKDLISIGNLSYAVEGPISIVYSNNNNIENGIIKNIDYIPFPWDYDAKVYER